MPAMTDLAGKHIVLGLSGGIACYKGAELCRALIREGATVQVVMTEAATRFIDWVEPLLRRESYLALLVERPEVHNRLLRLLGLARWPLAGSLWRINSCVSRCEVPF